jgi:hypothetical protein
MDPVPGFLWREHLPRETDYPESVVARGRGRPKVFSDSPTRIVFIGVLETFARVLDPRRGKGCVNQCLLLHTVQLPITAGR